jgi:hypothetical protein
MSGLFKQHIRAIPSINSAYWSFAISGRVQRPLILSYADLLAYPAEDVPCALVCIGGSGLLGEALWRGVRLGSLLAEVEIAPDAHFASAHSADGYHAGCSLDLLRQAWLITHMDGAPLPPEHGFPARLLLPGHAGHHMPKWILRIDLANVPQPSFWQVAEDRPLVSVVLRRAEMRRDGIVRLSGHAYAPRTLIELAIQFDDGAPHPVETLPATAGGMIPWQFAWTPPYPGDFHIRLSAPHARHYAAILRVPAELWR